MIFIIFIVGCDNSKDYPKTSLGVNDVTKIVLYPNHPTLIADGIAELTFKYKIYANDNLLKNDIFTPDMITIRTSEGEIVKDGVFRTASGAGSTLSFQATLGKIESENRCVVNIVPPRIISDPEVTIPVVFHFYYTKSSKEMCDNLTMETLQQLIDKVNKSYNGSYKKSACGVDTKIQFKLAETNPSGISLLESGIERIKFDENNEPYYLDIQNTLNNPNYSWKGYLNIFVYPSYSMSNNLPRYIKTGSDPIVGLANIEVDDFESVTDFALADLGISISPSTIISITHAQSPEQLEGMIGRYFGLLPTYTEDDYCSDTYLYEDMYTTLEKYTLTENEEDRIYFDSDNVMDKTSMSAVVTYEQALRIRQVMKSCIFREFK